MLLARRCVRARFQTRSIEHAMQGSREEVMLLHERGYEIGRKVVCYPRMLGSAVVRSCAYSAVCQYRRPRSRRVAW
eukprot:2644394-Rhodomonas_salina.2